MISDTKKVVQTSQTLLKSSVSHSSFNRGCAVSRQKRLHGREDTAFRDLSKNVSLLQDIATLLHECFLKRACVYTEGGAPSSHSHGFILKDRARCIVLTLEGGCDLSCVACSLVTLDENFENFTKYRYHINFQKSGKEIQITR